MNRYLSLARRTLSVLALFCLGLANQTQGAAAKNITATVDQFFDSSSVPRIQVEIPEKELDDLRKSEWRPGNSSAREEVSVTVREGGSVYTNVALHLKGAAGSFRGVEQNPAMTLNFDKFSKKQRFHGLAKLSLNNSVQDPSFISEPLCRELYLKAGVPVPRATHAFVELNGRKLGLYVLTEGWDKDFLKRHFRKTGGNLYDGGFIKEVTDELSTNAGDSKNQQDRIALAEAAQESNLTNRQARLEKILDVDRFISLVALDVMLWNWDGYAQNRNNWRLYHDSDSDRMVFMPHGLDQMLWKPDGSILPPMRGLVAKAVLGIPEWRDRYVERMRELRRTVFLTDSMTNRARAIAAKFANALREQDPDSAKEQEKALDGLCSAIERRARSLDQQLSRPVRPVEFNHEGFVRLENWNSQSDFGHPTLQKAEGTGESLLQLGTQRGSSVGSWRTRVWLPQGRYQIEGKVKLEGIVPDPGDPRGGLGFRLGRDHPEQFILGSADWRTISREFSTDDPLSEVQIVCEFRGISGRAFVDLQSLRLRQLRAEH